MFNKFRKIKNRLINWFNCHRYKIKCGNDVIFNGIPFFAGNGNIVIGDCTRINSGDKYNVIGGDTRCVFITYDNGEINIAKHVGISNSAFIARTSIIIEEDVMIGGSCKIYDNDFHSLEYDKRMEVLDINIMTAPVRIKKGAFIGAHSIILKGVTIGEKSVVGAGSVVTKSIPDGEIWAGNPARFVRKVTVE